MNRKTKDEIKVSVRIQTVREAGRWFEEAFQARPDLREQRSPEELKFITGLARRSSGRIRIERAFAERFVTAWKHTFVKTGRAELLLSVQPYEARDPATGVYALAELIADISLALRAREGAPPKLDPVEALEAVEEARARARTGERTEAVAVAAQALGVSPNTLEKQRSQGATIRERVRHALAGTPADPKVNPHADHIILTEDGTSGVAIVIPKDG